MVLFATVLEKEIEKARASGWLRGKEMFFTLWLGTPVTLPLLLSRENSSPHPCSRGVKQCTSRWMGLSTPLDSYTQNIKNKIWKTSPEISARYKVLWRERKFCEIRLCSHLCVLFLSFVWSSKQECRPPLQLFSSFVSFFFLLPDILKLDCHLVKSFNSTKSKCCSVSCRWKDVTLQLPWSRLWDGP